MSDSWPVERALKFCRIWGSLHVTTSSSSSGLGGSQDAASPPALLVQSLHHGCIQLWQQLMAPAVTWPLSTSCSTLAHLEAMMVTLLKS